MKGLGKYFIGLLPPATLEAQFKTLKQGFSDQFQVKYALQAPTHLTLKMPFRYKEAKELELAARLAIALEAQVPFQLKLTRIGHFGRRNIHQQVASSESLMQLQTILRSFCKRSLHLVEELSDRNFQPHLTLAYKDLKPSHFDEVLEFARQNLILGEFLVDRAYLMKKVENRWQVIAPLPFGKHFENSIPIAAS